MALRILFAGTEGTGKTSCIEALAPTLAASHRILIPDPVAPTLLFQDERRALLGPAWGHAHRGIRRAAQCIRLYPLFLITNFALRVLMSRGFEAKFRECLSLSENGGDKPVADAIAQAVLSLDTAPTLSDLDRALTAI